MRVGGLDERNRVVAHGVGIDCLPLHDPARQHLRRSAQRAHVVADTLGCDARLGQEPRLQDGSPHLLPRECQRLSARFPVRRVARLWVEKGFGVHHDGMGAAGHDVLVVQVDTLEHVAETQQRSYSSEVRARRVLTFAWRLLDELDPAVLGTREHRQRLHAERESVHVYIPLVSMLVVSVVLSLLMYLIRRFF